MKKNKKGRFGTAALDEAININSIDNMEASGEETAATVRKKKRSSGNGMQKPMKIVITIMMIVSVILLAAACVNSFINTKLDVTDTNSEAQSGSDIQLLPTGFVFEEDNRGQSSKKSALQGLIDFLTGKNKDKNKTNAETPVTYDHNVGDSSSAASNSESNGETNNLQTAPDTLTTSVMRKEEFYNFLIIAKDKGGGNTDTMIIVSFDVPNGAISLLQIPRDTSVNYKGGIRKINSIFQSGYGSIKGKTEDKTEKGIETLSTNLVQNFGIVIDRYVIVDIEGFKSIVDTIGGVDVYVQQDMVYKDQYQDLDINLKKGMNHLNGEKAEDFVRFRKGYINQDLGRMDAQKIFMSAFLKKLFSMSTVTKVPELIGHIMDYVTTNVTLQEATYLGTRLLDMDMSKITMHTLQGTAGSATYYNGVSYFSPYKKANIDLVNQYFNVFNKDLGPENVTPKMIVPEYGSGKYEGGKTAEEIDQDNPDLMFSR